MFSDYKEGISLHPGEAAEKTTDSLWYVFCPECGKQINKSRQGSMVMQACPKCGIQLSIEVVEDQLIVGVKRPSSTDNAQNMVPSSKRRRQSISPGV